MQHLEKDITIFYIAARSFPDDVAHAWHALHKMLPETTGRTYYGISYREGGVIVYKAGVEERFAGEGESYGCQTFIIPKGDYLAETITDFPKQLSRFAPVFQMLLAGPGRHEHGCCVEWYLTDSDVVCMVRQKEAAAVSSAI